MGGFHNLHHIVTQVVTYQCIGKLLFVAGPDADGDELNPGV